MSMVLENLLLIIYIPTETWIGYTGRSEKIATSSKKEYI
jgi:hypothetical protein